jgi:hypothetical protein
MKKNIIAAISLCFLLGMACRKEHSSEDTYTSTDDFFQKNGASSQSFSFNNKNGGVFQTRGGAKVHFPANAFAGDGTVNISLKEAFSPADMILNGMPAMSDRGPLESGGEFYIGATMNGQDAQLAAGKQIQVDLPATGAKMDSMQVYNGIVSPDSSNPSRTNVTWVANNNTGNNITSTGGTATDPLYSMFASDVNWVNCDRLFDGKDVSYAVNAASAPSITDTRVFAHFSGYNAAYELHLDYTGSRFIAGFKELTVTIVGICIKNGQLLASVESHFPEDKKTCDMHFVPVTASELKAKLSELK